MLKKRLIFILYFLDGNFCLSRNFRLQKVGDIKWLLEKFKFHSIGDYIDELIFLNVSREKTWDVNQLEEITKQLMAQTFVPLTIGGGIRTESQVKQCFDIGADKILLNSAYVTNPELVERIQITYGAQSLVAGIDVRNPYAPYDVYIENGSIKVKSLKAHLQLISNLGAGEIFVNSIDRDGTGFGLDDKLSDQLTNCDKPIIFAGGAGKPEHFLTTLRSPHLQAVATGNLFNFMGHGFQNLKEYLSQHNVNVRK